MTGGTYPAKLLQQLFSQIYKGKKAPNFVQPENIVTAKIDIQSLNEGSRPMLASAFTPDEQTMTELFTKDTAPSEYTSFWAVPSPPDDLKVVIGDGGMPCISFTPKESFIIYRIMRKNLADRTVETISECTDATSLISVIDFSAEYGCSYEYYVVPIHPEIEINKERLCGPPSAGFKIKVLPEDNYMP